jgi:hypothetical protein
MGGLSCGRSKGLIIHPYFQKNTKSPNSDVKLNTKRKTQNFKNKLGLFITCISVKLMSNYDISATCVIINITL